MTLACTICRRGIDDRISVKVRGHAFRVRLDVEDFVDSGRDHVPRAIMARIGRAIQASSAARLPAVAGNAHQRIHLRVNCTREFDEIFDSSAFHSSSDTRRISVCDQQVL